jgi:hypothetical protein
MVVVAVLVPVAVAVRPVDDRSTGQVAEQVIAEPPPSGAVLIADVEADRVDLDRRVGVLARSAAARAAAHV